MALSEQEQRLLEQLEASLAADDPALARTFRQRSPQSRGVAAPRRSWMAAAGLLVGVAGLVAGMQSHWLVSVLGYLVMLLALLSAQGLLGASPPGSPGVAPAGPSARHNGRDLPGAQRNRSTEGHPETGR